MTDSMIFPIHCKHVGVVEGPFSESFEGPIYFLTEYVISLDGDRCAIFRVEHEGSGLIRNVRKIVQVSSEEETLFYEREVDLSDRTELIEIASRLCEPLISTVVFRGVDRHITFVHRSDLSEIALVEVLDVTPPEPGWLWYNIERMVSSGILGELQLKFTPKIADLREYEDRGDTTIFPCSVSGLKGYFMDSVTRETVDNADKITLVGCEITKKTFQERFPHIGSDQYGHIDTCPLKRVPEHPFIARCCMKENSGPTEINGMPGFIVHWGASPLEILEGVKHLATMIHE